MIEALYGSYLSPTAHAMRQKSLREAMALREQDGLDKLGSAIDGIRSDLRALIDKHDSDCATHNEPAYPNGPCDCALSHPASAEN